MSQAPLLAAETEERPTSSGTGFIVSRHGHMLTNHHIVDGCVSIRATTEMQQQELVLVGSDAKNDLAVLEMTSPIKSVGRFREGANIRSRETVVAVGYPLQGVLASDPLITTGTVDAPVGSGNDAPLLQMTVPVLPGHSGGPLFDQSGFIVGIVETRLNALAMFSQPPDFPDHGDFAVNGTVAKAFLDAHNIKYDTGIPTLELTSADIGEAAKPFTLLVQCYAETLEGRYRRLLAERGALEAEGKAIKERRVKAKPGRAAMTRKGATEGEIQEYARKAQRNAFDLAYLDFLNGHFDHAAVAFQRVINDYPPTALTASAQYWLGESFYHQRDYVQAIKAFQHVSNDYPHNEKIPTSLLKLGQAARQLGYVAMSKKSFKRVIEEFPSSDESMLAKKKLADFR